MQQRERRGERQLRGRQRKIVAGARRRRVHFPAQAKPPIADRRFAEQIAEGSAGCVVFARAVGREIHNPVIEDVVATESRDHRPALHRERFRSALEIRRDVHASPPSAVGARQQRRDLSELSLLPCEAQPQGSKVQARSALPRGIHQQLAGVRKVEVRAHWLRLHARAPRVLRILPQRYIRIRERVGRFHLPQLEIDPGVARFEVGKRRPPLRSRLQRRSRRNLRIALQQAGQIPAAVVAAHDVDAGLGRAQRGDLKFAAQQGTKTNRGKNILRTDHRLCAEGGVVVNDQAFQIETRSWQNAKAHVLDRNPAAQCRSNRPRNLVAQLAHPGPEQKKNQQQPRNRRQPAPGTHKIHLTIRNVRDQRVSPKK